LDKAPQVADLVTALDLPRDGGEPECGRLALRVVPSPAGLSEVGYGLGRARQLEWHLRVTAQPGNAPVGVMTLAPEEVFCRIHLIPERFCADIDHTGLEPCPEDPTRLAGQPIGQYHCPHCGCMQLAGTAHLAHDEGCALGLDVAEFW